MPWKPADNAKSSHFDSPPKRERNREPEKEATEGKLLRGKDHAGAGWKAGDPTQGLSAGVLHTDLGQTIHRLSYHS